MAEYWDLDNGFVVGEDGEPIHVSYLFFLLFVIFTNFLQLIGGARIGLVMEDFHRHYTHYTFVLEEAGDSDGTPANVSEVI